MDREFEQAKREGRVNPDNPNHAARMAAWEDRRQERLNGQIRILKGPNAGQAFSLPHAGRVIVGRSKNADVRIFAPEFSRRHFQVQFTKTGFWIEDLDSASGIYLNHQRATRDILKPGDVIRVGSTELVFESVDRGHPSDYESRESKYRSPLEAWDVHNNSEIFACRQAMTVEPDNGEAIIRYHKLMREYKLHHLWRARMNIRQNLREDCRCCQDRPDWTRVCERCEDAVSHYHCFLCRLPYPGSTQVCPDCDTLRRRIASDFGVRLTLRHFDGNQWPLPAQKARLHLLADIHGLLMFEQLWKGLCPGALEHLSEELRAEYEALLQH